MLLVKQNLNMLKGQNKISLFPQTNPEEILRESIFCTSKDHADS